MVEHRSRETRGGTEPRLRECRHRIEALAGDGRFRVLCARTGVSPAPVAGLCFPSRPSAATAARLTRRYRAVLRQWDPETVWCDPIVHERRPRGPALAADGTDTGPYSTDVPATGGEP